MTPAHLWNVKVLSNQKVKDRTTLATKSKDSEGNFFKGHADRYDRDPEYQHNCEARGIPRDFNCTTGWPAENVYLELTAWDRDHSKKKEKRVPDDSP